MRRQEIIEQLAKLGHVVKHATLSKWIAIYEEESGRVQGQKLDDNAGEAIISAVDHMKASHERGRKLSFRDALRETQRGFSENVRMEVPATAGPAESITTYTLSEDQARMLSDLLEFVNQNSTWPNTVGNLLREIGQWMESIDGQLAELKDQEVFSGDERREILERLRRITDQGYVLMEAREGMVMMPRSNTNKPVPLPVPAEPELDLPWWQRSWEWLVERFTRAS